MFLFWFQALTKYGIKVSRPNELSIFIFMPLQKISHCLSHILNDRSLIKHVGGIWLHYPRLRDALAASGKSLHVVCNKVLTRVQMLHIPGYDCSIDNTSQNN